MSRSVIQCVAIFGLGSLLAPEAIAQERQWGDLSGQIVLKGPIPARRAIDLSNFPALRERVMGTGLLEVDWIVNSSNRGIKDVFVWIQPAGSPRGDSFPAHQIHPSLAKIDHETIEIDHVDGRYVPHVLAARGGQKLVIKNSSSIVYHPKFISDKSGSHDKLLKAGEQLVISEALVAEKWPIAVVCKIHPWMNAHLRVFGHPYFAITNEDGRFEIKNAPTGRCNIYYWHPGYGWLAGVEGRNGYAINIKAGKNDLGKNPIEGPATASVAVRLPAWVPPEIIEGPATSTLLNESWRALSGWVPPEIIEGPATASAAIRPPSAAIRPPAWTWLTIVEGSSSASAAIRPPAWAPPAIIEVPASAAIRPPASAPILEPFEGFASASAAIRLLAKAPPAIRQPTLPAPDPVAVWGNLQGRIVWKGEMPERKPINFGSHRDKAVFDKEKDLLDEDYIISSNSRGVKNTFIWIEPAESPKYAAFPAGRIHPRFAAPPESPIVIEQSCCRYIPHVAAAREGQSLVIQNSSPLAHKPIWFSLRNPQPNAVESITGRRIELRNVMADPFPIALQCGIHPWMKAHVRIFDHPYFAVTDDDGAFKIEDAPTGSFRLYVWHPANGWLGGAKGVNGSAKIRIAKGNNDLGKIEMERNNEK